ncbi:ankyrin repeat domain-containing protein [Candidatus Jidaibacter acanthamoebae]|nr:ankyrin repeat domain-containing protein [Candidatus Jidaibacter acanthamoeba]
MRYSKDFTFTNFVETNNLEKIKIALGRELELREFIDRKGNSLVSVAIEKGDLKLLEFLISKEADLNVVNADGKTPLMIAASKRSEEILRMLLENGAEIDKRNDRNSDRYKWTALMYAVNIGYSKGVKILIENGADVNKKDNDGWTALMLAASSNDKEMVKHLLTHPKIEINNQDLKGKTALIHAAENGALDVVDLLLNNRVDINKVDNSNKTALHYMVSGTYFINKEQQHNLILNFIKQGADLYKKPEHGLSIYDSANSEIRNFIEESFPHEVEPSTELLEENIKKSRKFLPKEKFLPRSNTTGKPVTWAGRTAYKSEEGRGF